MSMRSSVLGLAAIVFAVGAALPALAGPCGGSAPNAGASFRGPVLHVEDGQRLCIARGHDPAQWVEVQLVDAQPKTERGALMSVAFGQDVDCRITAAAPAAQAICTLAGRSIVELAAAPAARKAGRDWR